MIIDLLTTPTTQHQETQQNFKQLLRMRWDDQFPMTFDKLDKGQKDFKGLKFQAKNKM